MTGRPTSRAVDRIGPTQRPAGPAAGFQKWRELFFLHWTFPPAVVRKLVPPSMELDLWMGRAFVGLVPFIMNDIRPSWLPAPFALDFLETNVRTYVLVDGEPGVFFFSLEASSWLAVTAARLGWSLPYHHARMTYDGGATRRYTSERHDDATARLAIAAKPGPLLGASAPGTLEHFLLERYLLFVERDGRILRGQVHHAPYPAQRAELAALDESLLAAAGLPNVNAPPELVHYARGVDVEVFGPSPLVTKR